MGAILHLQGCKFQGNGGLTPQEKKESNLLCNYISLQVNDDIKELHHINFSGHSDLDYLSFGTLE